MALQSVLITGCSVGGIGCSIAEEFQKRGLHVFATARTPTKMGSIGDLPNVTTLALDVTSHSSIVAAVEIVKAKTGGTLNYLVNNSGSQYVMPTLDLDIEEAKKMFDVNVWGVIAVTQAFAPLIIAAKGSIVNAASIAGCLYPPWMGKTMPPLSFQGWILIGAGVYAGSKSAIAIISETLRLEMEPFGVKVVTCITGAIKTNLFVNGPEHKLPSNSIYSPAQKQIAERASGEDVKSRSTASEFARDLVRDTLNGASGLIYRGKMSTMVRWMSAYMPTPLLVRPILVKISRCG